MMAPTTTQSTQSKEGGREREGGDKLLREQTTPSGNAQNENKDRVRVSEILVIQKKLHEQATHKGVVSYQE